MINRYYTDKQIMGCISKAKVLGFPVQEVISQAGYKYYIVAMDSDNEIWYIPDDVERFFKIDYYLHGNLTEYRKVNIKIIGGNGLKSCYGMFHNLSLNSLDLTMLNTSSVTTMHRMFFCSSFKELKLEGLDTSKVRTMKEMFAYCNVIDKVNFNDIDTSNVHNMVKMFYSSKFGKDLDLRSLNIDSLDDVEEMFSYFTGLTIYLGELSKLDKIHTRMLHRAKVNIH